VVYLCEKILNDDDDDDDDDHDVCAQNVYNVKRVKRKIITPYHWYVNCKN